MTHLRGFMTLVFGLIFLATAVRADAADTVAPSVPSGLSATRASPQQINLAWNAATDNVGIREYRLQRCAGTACTNFALLAITSGRSFANWDNALSAATSFRYRVLAVDTSGNSSAVSSAVTVASGPAGDVQPPTVPGAFKATRAAPEQINLTWNAATDNVALREYRLERCAGSGCSNFALMAITAVSGFSNWDTALKATSVSYRVRAVDTSGNYSNYSSVATVPASGTTPPSNRAPVISGSPGTTVVVGSTYTFTPTASDADGQTLRFSIMGAPAWATINTSTGALQGTPGAGNVGRTDGIVITVSDGTSYASLPAFSINVVQVATGNATVSWLPPTVRTDGTALTNLAGYEIRYGTNAAALDRTVILPNAGLTRYVIEGLTSGTWYFGIVAFDGAGLRSTVSNVRSKTLP